LSSSPQKQNFFFAKTRDGFEGVQRRGHVKGAGKFRVHRRPLTGSTAGIAPFVKSRVEWRKNEEKSDFGQEHRMEADTDTKIVVREIVGRKIATCCPPETQTILS